MNSARASTATQSYSNNNYYTNANTKESKIKPPKKEGFMKSL